TRCTFNNNSAITGGALFGRSAVSGPVPDSEHSTVSDCTFTGNSAVDEGGAIWLSENTTIRNTTIAGGNRAAEGSGIYVEDEGSPTVTLFDPIVAGNQAGISNVDGLGNGMAANSAYNIIGDNGANFFVNGQNHNQVGTLANPIDPTLGPLQNNGGL